MKVPNAAPSVLDSNGTGVSTGFRIASNAHAFKMLSSGLYSDKIGAVLREIGCNAADAHVAAGIRHVPIEVKLANQLDPMFHIRDRGFGLSEEDVRELYTTYFASTKQSSNDFTGAFGLGSKSPFSYTDTFTVTSCYEGQMHTYVAHLDKHGSPVITHMGVKPVDKEWPSGVMISFPVRAQDFAEFQNKARQIYQWFSPRPQIKGLEDNWATTKQAWHDSENIAFFNGETTGPTVLMGNVLYPLAVDKLYPTPTRAHYVSRTFEQQVAHSTLMFKLPIGTVQVAASREQLQYDDDSRATLLKAIRNAAQEILKEASTRLFKAFKSEANDWTRRIAIHSVRAALPTLFQHTNFSLLSPTLESMGLSRGELASLTEAANTPAISLPASITAIEGGVSVKAIESSTSRTGRTSYMVKDGMVQRYGSTVPARIEVSETTAIFVGDCEKPEERLFASMSGTSGLLVSVRARDKRPDALALAHEIGKQLGGVPVILVSSFPEIEKEVKAKGTDIKVPVAPFNSTVLGNPDAWLGGVTEKPLSSLKAPEMYYLVRDGNPGGGSTEISFEYLDETNNRVVVSTPTWDGGAREVFRHLPDCLEGLGLKGLIPEGIVIVTPSQVTRLKLIENGLRPFTGFIRELVQTSAFRVAVENSGLNGIPRDFGAGSYTDHAIDSILGHLRGDEDFAAKLLEQEMDSEDRLKLLAIKAAPKFSDLQRPKRGALELIFGAHWKFFNVPSAVFTTKTQVREHLANRYPVLAVLNPGVVSYKVSDAFYQALPLMFVKLSPVRDEKLAA